MVPSQKSEIFQMFTAVELTDAGDYAHLGTFESLEEARQFAFLVIAEGEVWFVEIDEAEVGVVDQISA